MDKWKQSAMEINNVLQDKHGERSYMGIRRGCDTCLHRDSSDMYEPCFSCNRLKYSNWQSIPEVE